MTRRRPGAALLVMFAGAAGAWLLATAPSKELAALREAVALNRTDPMARDLRNPEAVRKQLESFGFETGDDAPNPIPTKAMLRFCTCNR